MELDNTKLCYQLIKKMTKVKKLHDAHLHKHDLLIVTLTVVLQYSTLSNYKHDACTVLLVLKSGWW